MQFNRGACVYTFDRHLVGHVTHIVIDPDTKLVTHVVVRQGLFFLEDKVIPIHMFESSCSEGVILREGIGDLHNLPNFEEPYYAIADRPNDLETAKIGSMLGGAYMALPGGPVRLDRYLESQPYIRGTKQNIPAGEVALREGARVISSDYHDVGDVESVLVDPETKHVTDVMISKNLRLTKVQRLVPVSWIRSIYDDMVYLKVDETELKAIPRCA